MIPIKECKEGYLYHISARNGNVGIYQEEKKGFVLRRIKFGDIFPFVENHWDSSKRFGTAKPFKELEKAPQFVDENSLLEYLYEWQDKVEEIPWNYQ